MRGDPACSTAVDGLSRAIGQPRIDADMLFVAR
jgi:hypothetical protein